MATRYQLWQATIDRSLKDERWHEYDCDIQQVIREFNRHLSGQGGYQSLDWRLIKAMIWTESGGPDNRAWKRNPMQIGNPGDPGLRALLSGNEGGELILPPQIARQLTETNARSSAVMNIRAGAGYLLMRLARFRSATLADDNDTAEHTLEAKPGDTLFKLARTHGTTPDILKGLNPGKTNLSPGMTLKYKKACVRKIIAGWDPVTTARIATRYNVGDAAYAAKLNYCLGVMAKASRSLPCAA